MSSSAITLFVILCLSVLCLGAEAHDCWATTRYHTWSPDDDWTAGDRLITGTVGIVDGSEPLPGWYVCLQDEDMWLEWNLAVRRPAFEKVTNLVRLCTASIPSLCSPPYGSRRWTNASNDRFVVLVRSLEGDTIYHLAPRDEPSGRVRCSDAIHLCRALRQGSEYMHGYGKQVSLHVVLLDHWPWPEPEAHRSVNATARHRTIDEAIRISELPARGRLDRWG